MGAIMRRLLTLVAVAVAASTSFAESAKGTQKGTPAIKSITAMAFGPDGVLFIGDPASATIFAIATGDTKPTSKEDVKVEKITEQIGSMIGVPAAQVAINDMKVNPASGNVYLGVTRGKAMDAAVLIVRITRDGKLAEFPMKDVSFSSVVLSNATDKQRMEAITSLGFASGKLIVAGLSNEEFSSTLRSIDYPFVDANKGAGVKIFHGAHGKFETQAPVRTFTIYKVGDKEQVLAAYTCTPLVTIPVEDLKAGAQVTGTTIAELGNRNRPLDIIVYKKDGKDFVLMANNARGIMKIPADQFGTAESITSRPKGDTAGVKYETVAEWKGVQQLDKLDEGRALILVKADNGDMNVKSIAMP